MASSIWCSILVHMSEKETVENYRMAGEWYETHGIPWHTESIWSPHNALPIPGRRVLWYRIYAGVCSAGRTVVSAVLNGDPSPECRENTIWYLKSIVPGPPRKVENGSVYGRTV